MQDFVYFYTKKTPPEGAFFVVLSYDCYAFGVAALKRESTMMSPVTGERAEQKKGGTPHAVRRSRIADATMRI